MIKIRILSEATKQKTINVTPAGLRLASQPPPEERHEYLLTPEERNQIIQHHDLFADAIISAFQTKKVDVAAVNKVKNFFNKYYMKHYASAEETGDPGEYGDPEMLGEFFMDIGVAFESRKFDRRMRYLAMAMRHLESAFVAIPLRCDDDENDDCFGFPSSGEPEEDLYDDEEFFPEIQPEKPAAVKTLKGKR